MGTYDTTSSTAVKTTGSVNMGAVDNADRSDPNPTITMRATYTAPVSGITATSDTILTCGIETIAPTQSPTSDPTASPVTDPTAMPTVSPTFGQVGAYLRSSDLCAVGRCDCFSEAQNCCLEGGSPPAGGSCDAQLWPIEIAADAESTTTEALTLEVYPIEFTFGMTVNFTITAYGTFNLTDFESLSWATRNGSGDVEEDILAIDVSPPGALNASFEGNVAIENGGTTGSLSLSVTTSTLKCEADEECIGYDECLSTAVGYVIEVTACETGDNSGSGCTPMYPNTVYVAVSRSNELCAIIYGPTSAPTNGDNEESEDTTVEDTSSVKGLSVSMFGFVLTMCTAFAAGLL